MFNSNIVLVTTGGVIQYYSIRWEDGCPHGWAVSVDSQTSRVAISSHWNASLPSVTAWLIQHPICVKMAIKQEELTFYSNKLTAISYHWLLSINQSTVKRFSYNMFLNNFIYYIHISLLKIWIIKFWMHVHLFQFKSKIAVFILYLLVGCLIITVCCFFLTQNTVQLLQWCQLCHLLTTTFTTRWQQ